RFGTGWFGISNRSTRAHQSPNWLTCAASGEPCGSSWGVKQVIHPTYSLKAFARSSKSHNPIPIHVQLSESATLMDDTERGHEPESIPLVRYKRPRPHGWHAARQHLVEAVVRWLIGLQVPKKRSV